MTLKIVQKSGVHNCEDAQMIFQDDSIHLLLLSNGRINGHRKTLFSCMAPNKDLPNMDILAVIQICGLKTPQFSARGIVYCPNQTKLHHHPIFIHFTTQCTNMNLIEVVSHGTAATFCVQRSLCKYLLYLKMSRIETCVHTEVPPPINIAISK